ncbi:flagellar protein FlgN [Caldicellulosiruptoraceae bacterium PP1]
MVNPNEIEGLKKLLEAKNILLDEFLNLTMLQQEAILNENYEFLAEITEKKAQIIDKVNNVDDKFIELFEKIKRDENINSFDELKNVDKEQIIKIKNFTSSIMEKLKTIKEIDEKNAMLINSKYEELKRNIKKLKSNQEAIRDYSGYKAMKNQSIFDKKE